MKKFFYIMAGFAVVLLVLYTYLGGFAAPDVKTVTSETRHVVGIPFEGSIEDEDFGGAFRMAASLVKSGRVKGMLGNIYYNDPDKSGDSIRAFIGVIVTDTAATLPDGYELRTVAGGKKVVRAEAEGNIALLPRKLYKAVFDYAEEQELKLEDFYVEWFPADDRGVVEVPVKE